MIAVPRNDKEQRSVSFTIHSLEIIGENGTAFRPKKAGVISPASIAKNESLSTEAGHTLADLWQAVLTAKNLT